MSRPQAAARRLLRATEPGVGRATVDPADARLVLRRSRRDHRWLRPPPVRGQGARSARPRSRRDCRGEVFPAAILFMAMMLTMLVAVHVVLLSIASAAAQSAAEFGLSAARQRPALESRESGAPLEECRFEGIYGTHVPTDPRECDGMVAASAAMHASLSMVTQTRLPEVRINELARVVSVRTFGGIRTPVLGLYEVVGQACAPTDAGNRGVADADFCFTDDRPAAAP